mgnify:CR=1 FL=1
MITDPVTGVISANNVGFMWDDYVTTLDDGSELYGAWKQDDDGMWRIDKTSKYEYSAISCPDFGVLQIVWSKYGLKCAECSPCFPYQGDLDTEGDCYIAYAPPPDLLSDGETKFFDRVEEIKPMEELVGGEDR